MLVFLKARSLASLTHLHFPANRFFEHFSNALGTENGLGAKGTG